MPKGCPASGPRKSPVLKNFLLCRGEVSGSPHEDSLGCGTQSFGMLPPGVLGAEASFAQTWLDPWWSSQFQFCCLHQYWHYHGPSYTLLRLWLAILGGFPSEHSGKNVHVVHDFTELFGGNVINVLSLHVTRSTITHFFFLPSK